MAAGANPRVYTISTETATGAVHSGMLIDEIEAEAAITTALSHIDTAGGELFIYFAADLSGAEQTALDAVVLAHQGVTTVTTWQKWEANTLQTDVTGSFVEALNQTAQPIRAGTYKISWSMELSVETGGLGSGVHAKVSVNSNLKADFHREGSGSDAWHTVSGWDFQTYQEGATPTFVVEFRLAGGTDTARIRKIKIGIEAMDA